MAKGSNTWCKKLMAKQKKFAQRHARKPHALTFSLAALDAAQVASEIKRKAGPEFNAPMRAGFNPGRGRKGTLSRDFRAAVELRDAKRQEFFAALAGV